MSFTTHKWRTWQWCKSHSKYSRSRTTDRSCTDLTEKPQHVAVIYHAEVQVVVVVQVAQQVHPPGVIIIAVRPTEVAPTLLENLNISVASFHEKLINAEKLQ